ncbi:Transcriptional regulator containing PAS, AAA-type ATPase, and DNA-binding Fis domains [Evansella caseinilytica]|uniref:Transcriptional regulator containing PAS, AAA-type ATPase, and DNA-binding Fis domains n=1 Tax=Evansella caseinilytica TaxID=1503961 RepID=A0A1H3UTD8_9BACI|nr:sigma-54-dependent Fis family transcriptional regulator [Evansella caseinilytica]SDZ65682.1 Transcriptional regulator containing PAS, AAA-type ATPase, and DNA-binding Fis domains [Evansella caseinilytica]
MKTNVLFIAPYRGLKELALSLSEGQPDMDIIVKEADLSAAIPLIKFYEQQNIDFIISRGGTAKLIEQYTQIPVVEVKVSGYDIIRTLTLIKDYKMKVQMIGFPNICQGVLSIAQLLDMDIAYTTIQHEGEVENAVMEARNNGAQVLLGDTVTVRTAQQHGLQGVMITSGKESVLEAFQQVIDMAKALESRRKQTAVFHSLLAQHHDGIALFEENGEFIFSNQTFTSALEKEPMDQQQTAFSFPQELTAFLHRIQSGEVEQHQNEIISINGKTFVISGGNFHCEDKLYLYITLYQEQLNTKAETGVKVLHNPVFPTSFAQMVTSSAPMKVVIEKAKELAKKSINIVIYGEDGTGKRFVSHAIHTAGCNRDGDFIEIEISAAPDKNISAIIPMVKQLEKGTIYIKGAEYLPFDDQQCIVQLSNDNSELRFVFAFNENPDMLTKNQLLMKQFTKKINAEWLSVPPLRERTADIDELIRMFIASYNTKYGKQIVGLRQDTLSELHGNDWSKANVTELKQTIKDLVKVTEGDYIEKKYLQLIENRKSDKKTSQNKIDLTKTLEEIEKDIIYHVLEEENMNQTQAAKRLGINRTTLWRKLKG